MFDLHCHILPGIDDGADSWEESLEMARISVDSGVRTVVATPHMSPDLHPDQVNSLVAEFELRLSSRGLPLKVVPGMEARLEPELPELLREGRVLPLAGRFVLLELPHFSLPVYTGDLLFRVMLAGYQVILAHPERNPRVMENPELVFEWVSRGMLVQVNSGSVLGKFGSRVRQAAESLAKAGMVHFLGSDAHGAAGRRPDLAEAVKVLERLTPRAQEIAALNGEMLLQGKFTPPEVTTLPADPGRRKRWWRR